MQIEVDDKELNWLIKILSEKVNQLDSQGESIDAKRLEKIANDITRQTKMEK